MCLPCKAALGFTGLSFLEGRPLKDCTKLTKATKQNWLPARVCSSWLFVLRSRPCSPEGGVKTPAVKPCIVYIIVLLCSVGSKQCQQLTGFSPIGYCTQLLADLWNYTISVFWSRIVRGGFRLTLSLSQYVYTHIYILHTYIICTHIYIYTYTYTYICL